MEQRTVSSLLQENTAEVNRLLLKVSGIGITLLYGLTYGVYFAGKLDQSLGRLTAAAVSTYLLYGATVLLFRVPRVRRWFQYVFPLEMYITVAIGLYLFGAPISMFFIWLIPVIYAGLYADRNVMRLTAGLTLVTAPLLTWLVHGEQVLSDLLPAWIVMLIVVLRLISLVNRSRTILGKAEQELERNRMLQLANRRLLDEVAATAQEVGRVVEQLTAMTREINEAMNRIARESEQLAVGSRETYDVLLANYASVVSQAENAQAVGEAAHRMVSFGDQVQSRAQEGESAVEEIVRVIERIDVQSRDTGEKAVRLAESAQEITAISETIAGIARDVTVVAINASIEAARAGAAGRTFQVVANQVQRLAADTAEAANRILDLAGRVQGELDDINRTMAENRTVVRQGVDVSGSAMRKLGEIGQAITEMLRLLHGVARRAEDTQQSAARLAADVEQLKDRTGEHLAYVEAAAAATEETTAVMDGFAAVVARLSERAQALRTLLAERAAEDFSRTQSSDSVQHGA